MQTITFTQKLLRQRRFASFLVPILALVVGLSGAQNAFGQAGINRSSLTVSGTATTGSVGPNTYFGAGANAAATPPRVPFQNQALGNFDLTAGSLSITNAFTRITGKTPFETLDNSGFFRYRVYLNGTIVLPNFTNVTLPYVSGTGASTADPAIYSANTAINLVSGLVSGGTYTVEIRYEVAVISDTDPDGSGPRTLGDPGTTGYTATFTVPAPTTTPAGGSTTWISTFNTDWTVAANWSNGVPNRFADAIIPEKNSTNTNTSTPALLDSNPLLYEVRSLTLNGTLNSNRALIRIGQTAGGTISGATLNVYGDLNCFGGGVLGGQTGDNGNPNPALNSTVALRGNTQQVVRGILAIADLRVEGTGDKLVVNSINASNTFLFSNGTTAKVRTVSETFNPSAGTSTFALNTSGTAAVNLKTSGILFGETVDAYIEGVTQADRNLQAGVKQTFGNIGVDITPNRDIPGPTVQITRTVGNPLGGPTTTSVNDPNNPSGGIAGAKPVKRQYGVTGDVNNAPTVSTLVFHYLDSVDELNDNPEPNLIIFRTLNNGIPYGPVGGIVNTADNTVTQTGVTAINTITLGDKDKPLPVTLTAFDAKRAGADALVTWETASEINSKGYEVQVSVNGNEFRSLGFVASASANSTRATKYSFIDTEANKTGLRYYRLHQIDIDGKDAFFGPKSVSFDGKASDSVLTAYPNPFDSNDQFHLSIQSSAGKGQLRITDMTGRTIRKEAIELNAGITDFSVTNTQDLKAGIYFMQVSLPSGQTKNLKVVKR